MEFVPLTKQTIRGFKFVRRNLSVLLKMDKFIKEKFVPLHAKDWSYGCWCEAATIAIECMTSLISRVLDLDSRRDENKQLIVTGCFSTFPLLLQDWTTDRASGL